jgi:hypothetical protein
MQTMGQSSTWLKTKVIISYKFSITNSLIIKNLARKKNKQEENLQLFRKTQLRKLIPQQGIEVLKAIKLRRAEKEHRELRLLQR